MSEKNPGGRPPLSRETEVFTVIMPKELMARVREATRKRAGTLAGYVRQAVEEKLAREEEQEERSPKSDAA